MFRLFEDARGLDVDESLLSRPGLVVLRQEDSVLDSTSSVVCSVMARGGTDLDDQRQPVVEIETSERVDCDFGFLLSTICSTPRQ